MTVWLVFIRGKLKLRKRATGRGLFMTLVRASSVLDCQIPIPHRWTLEHWKEKESMEKESLEKDSEEKEKENSAKDSTKAKEKEK